MVLKSEIIGENDNDLDCVNVNYEGNINANLTKNLLVGALPPQKGWEPLGYRLTNWGKLYKIDKSSNFFSITVGLLQSTLL